MKTKIITLESHDDLVSVRDKLSWAKTPRILLILPKYEKVSLRLLDLKILQRHARSLGAQLGLVTRRANVRRDAESLRIPVFASAAIAQREIWTESIPQKKRTPKAPRRDLREIRDRIYADEPAWRTSLLGRASFFSLGVAAVLAVAILFVPRANLTLYPEAQTQALTIPVAASESAANVSITGEIPARRLSVSVSAEEGVKVKNKIIVPKSKAKGIARFTNLGAGEVNIPAGTVIATADEEPIRFITTRDTLLGVGAKFVDVSIEAYQAGASGNVSKDAIKIVEGSLGISVSATNPNPLKDGADAEMVGATEEDRATLRETMRTSLRRDAEEKLRAQILPADILLPDSLESSQLEENFEPPVGLPGATLSLTMKAEFSARYIAADDLNQLALIALNSSAMTGFEPFGATTFKTISEPVTDTAGVARFEIVATRTLLRNVDAMRVFSIARGRNAAAVKDELVSALSLRAAPEISITPSWWRWIPLIPLNVAVETR